MKRKSLSKKLVFLVVMATTMSNFTAYAGEMHKDETVYVILDENGKPTSNIVSDKISSDEVLGEFEDKSSLSNIKNVKSDEKAKINGETLKWNVNSNELYYEGNSEKELPLNIEIKYEFNNKEVDPKDVLGKEGSFKMSASTQKRRTLAVSPVLTVLVVLTILFLVMVLPAETFSTAKFMRSFASVS